MAEIEKKVVAVSRQFDSDLIDIFIYGEDTFGFTASKIFIGDIYNLVWNLDSMYLYHPECRYIPTKGKIYRNIILGSYLIIYRIRSTQIEVLRAVSSRISVSSIRKIRSINL